MYRKIVKIKKAEDLTIQLPKEYLNKEVEVLALEVNNEGFDELLEKKKAAREAIEFFQHYSNRHEQFFKFDRDEANER